MQADAKHADLKQLCAKMSKDQQKDIAQMRVWMKEWPSGASTADRRKK